LAPNDLWQFPKINSALKRRRFQDIEDPPPQKKKCDDGTESYSATEVTKMFGTVPALLGKMSRY
jgi:hypothetical protein